MARAWCEEYKGGVYHVIARGNNKEYIHQNPVRAGIASNVKIINGAVIYTTEKILQAL